MSYVLHFYRMTYKTYDMQEYILFILSGEKMSRSLEALRLQPLGEPPQCFQWY